MKMCEGVHIQYYYHPGDMNLPNKWGPSMNRSKTKPGCCLGRSPDSSLTQQSQNRGGEISVDLKCHAATPLRESSHVFARAFISGFSLINHPAPF